MAGLTRKMARHNAVKASIWGASVLLAWDVVYAGSFLLTLMVVPIWLLVSILKNAIQRSRWELALVRIAIPALTLGLVLANNAVQLRIAQANSARVVAACKEYNTANGQFPKALDELVPRYLPSVPRAKFCVTGKFLYMNYQDHPLLVWYSFPVFGKNVYDFDKGRWSYLD